MNVSLYLKGNLPFRFPIRMVDAVVDRRPTSPEPGEGLVVFVTYNNVVVEVNDDDWTETPEGVLIGRPQPNSGPVILGFVGHPVDIDRVIRLFPKGRVDVDSAKEWERERD